ncbi:DUF2867 domain-containing protein [Pseudonocardia acaciae]|uniref:DUF2867 domain-containing protein n=1 Tax=Pseudonocardia acaciae TaxID=551276 RepID=UPI000491570E|nr:DUF2867 domain-containing protein [Pseudonocardia acaciae]
MKLPNTAHTARPWRIHEIAPDFTVEDVWALPTPGGPDDLPRLVEQTARGEFPGRDSPLIVQFLWAARWTIGAVLGLDRSGDGLDSRAASLRERLPADMREVPAGPEFTTLPFRSVYQLHDEWAAEIANRTVHGVMHMGWVPDGAGGYRGQMAVLVKPNGLFGAAYMAAIKPFRHLFVYPALMRAIEREWRASEAVDG